MKHFQPRASEYLVGHLCQVCDGPVEPADAVNFEVDQVGSGDDERLRVKVWHGWCLNAIKEAAEKAVAHETERVWNEAVQLLTHNDPETALQALQFRHACAVRKLNRESGARVVESLLGKAS